MSGVTTCDLDAVKTRLKIFMIRQLPEPAPTGHSARAWLKYECLQGRLGTVEVVKSDKTASRFVAKIHRNAATRIHNLPGPKCSKNRGWLVKSASRFHTTCAGGSAPCLQARRVWMAHRRCLQCPALRVPSSMPYPRPSSNRESGRGKPAPRSSLLWHSRNRPELRRV